MSHFKHVLAAIALGTLAEYLVFKDMLAVAVGVICFWSGFLKYIKLEDEHD